MAIRYFPDTDVLWLELKTAPEFPRPAGGRQQDSVTSTTDGGLAAVEFL